MRKTFAHRQAAQQRPMQATCLQVARAYRQRYGEPLPNDMTYQAAACKLAQDMGGTVSAQFILAQSNDPTLPD